MVVSHVGCLEMKIIKRGAELHATEETIDTRQIAEISLQLYTL
jgi:hypothetical protein